MSAVVRLLAADGADPEHARLRVRALMGLATATFEQQGLDPAVGYLDQAAAAASELGDRELGVICHSQRATLYGRSGNIGEALREIQLAARHLDTLPARDRSVVLLNYGNILMHSGDLPGAVDRFGRSADIAAEHGLHREAFMSRSNQGYAAYLAGDLPQALALLDEAAAVEADASGAVVRLDRARVLIEAGLLDEALAVLEDAAGLAVGEPQQQVLGEIEVELARVLLLLGRPREAHGYASRARSRFRRRHAPVWTARAELILGQVELLTGRDPQRVLRTAERLTARFETAEAPLRAEHRLIAAEAAWMAGEVEAARAHLAQVERIRKRLSLRGQLQVAKLQANLALVDGREAAARRILGGAAKVLLNGQSGSNSTDLRSAVTVYAVPLARLHVEMNRDRGARALFEATEKWRAFGRRLQPVRPPDDPELADLLTRMRELREGLRYEPVGPGRESLVRQEYDLRREVRARDWVLSRGEGGSREFSYRDMRAALAREDADLISLVGHKGRLLVMGVVGGRAIVREVADEDQVSDHANRARADLDAAGRHELGVFQDSVTGSLRSTMARLDELILRPLGVGSRRLVIVPHRRTHTLPWGMAPSLRGVPVTVSVSATDWTGRVSDPGTRDGRAPVVRALAGPAVARADEEVGEVAAIWPGGVAIDSDTTRVAHLRDALGEADVVHVAAHGDHNQQNPMFASVRLTGGPMYIYDLQHSGGGAAHVVLSSCEVGRSTVRPGDESLGLSAGLLALGAQCVVAGLCRVPDDVAASTMRDYHAALAAGAASDEAMARAAEQGPLLASAFQVSGAGWRMPR